MQCSLFLFFFSLNLNLVFIASRTILESYLDNLGFIHMRKENLPRWDLILYTSCWNIILFSYSEPEVEGRDDLESVLLTQSSVPFPASAPIFHLRSWGGAGGRWSELEDKVKSRHGKCESTGGQPSCILSEVCQGHTIERIALNICLNSNFHTHKQCTDPVANSRCALYRHTFKSAASYFLRRSE